MHRLLNSSPLRTFTVMSLVLITLMVLGTGFVLSSFFRQAILDREALIIRDFVQAIASQEHVSEDPGDTTMLSKEGRLTRRFLMLTNLSEVVRIKVYNRHGEIAWSDEPSFIGTKVDNNLQFHAAIMGGTDVVFYSQEEYSDAGSSVVANPVVEFYVPFSIRPTAPGKPSYQGVLGLYRSAATLNEQIRRGMALQWLVAGLGGLLLYAALFGLFRAVYWRQCQAESQLSKLSTEHERIVQMEKLSAMGQMIGEIAHQINNPLVGVMNLAQLAQREAKDPERTCEILGQIHQAGSDCRTFVQRMLEFTKISRFERVPTDMCELVRETLSLFQQSTKYHTETMIQLPQDPIILSVDPTLIRHALFNLLNNAAQASEWNGVIAVRLMQGKDERGDGPGWSLVVEDQGSGLSKETLGKLFVPFFTTRSEGIGLGLSVVQHIVVQHAGQIIAENRPEGGARFTIWLPDTEPNAQ